MSDEKTERLADAIQTIMRAFLVSGREGMPAEGKMPFNPFYFNILRMIESDGPMRASTLSKALNAPKTTIATAVQALRKRGILAQEKDPTDGRAQIISLTTEGVQIAQSIRRQDVKNSAAMLALVGEAKADAVLDVFEAIANGLK